MRFQLLISYFSFNDLLAFPACFLIFYMVIRAKLKKIKKAPEIGNLFYRAFFLKVICTFAFAILTQYYFQGGDTALYYQATQDLRTAIKADPTNLRLALESSSIGYKNPLFDYFYYDGYTGDLTYNYMISASNYFPPKAALIPSYIFFNSYISICLVFSFFALGGGIRLFKTFYHFFPSWYREIGFACLFLPSVVYWSSGLLKDSITFGCVGYALYGILNIFIKKRKILISVLIVILAGLVLYIVKAYILLVLLMSVLIWQFAEINKLIENKTLRMIFSGLTFLGSAGVTLLLLQYITSFEAAQQYQLDKIAGNAEYQRDMYAWISQRSGGNDSFYSVNTSNPFLMVIGGISATFYRPFLWELNSPIAFLSFMESSVMLFLTLNFIFKKGFKRFFQDPFKDPRLLMCFIFAFVFAVAVGITSANFGALSRYKIPCMPFYLILVLGLYRQTGLAYPIWFRKILDLAVPIRKTRAI